MQQALEQVVADEAHHAAFAWKVVRWAIERQREVDQQVLEVLDAVITPAEITKIGNGKYREEDVKLLCELKTVLMSHYNGREKSTNVIETNRVSSKIMEIVS